MSRAYLAFTAKGEALSYRLAEALPGSVSRCGGDVTLKGWTAEHFAQDEALIFVGAVGIAVRAIAPHCRSKAADPAVVVVDEGGNFAVPLLSGHLGGANALARALAGICGAVPVITTATDVNGLFAVDLWAKAQNCAVLDPERIKHVSGTLLAGQTVRYWSPWPVAGETPAGGRAVSRAYLAFTAKGEALSYRLAEALPGSVSRCGGDVTLKGWTAEHFAQDEALIFVGAVGIAVRAIAPHCRSKAADPAVVVVDEGGNFAVPLLSGHLGGANALARALAGICGAVPVITTATDVNGLFAVDLWAKAQNCAVLDPERIKHVSGTLLAGQTVRYWSPWPVAGETPAGVEKTDPPEAADFALTLTPQGGALHLVPRIGVLGVGCRRGTTAQQLEEAFAAFCAASGLSPAAVCAAASIDLKKDEPGLAEFCKAHGWPITFYPADELRAVPGQFTPSAFVASVTGVDNVCERSAVKASGGTLLLPKTAGGGVTLALAVRPFAPDWRTEQ